MEYRNISAKDAKFLTKVFSVLEYELYFAENRTS